LAQLGHPSEAALNLRKDLCAFGHFYAPGCSI
jgi:hypothetical protein